MSKSTQFEYAWCLVRSKYNDDIRKGIVLLEGEVLGYPALPFPTAVRVCPSLLPLVMPSLRRVNMGPCSPVTSQLFYGKLTNRGRCTLA